MKLTYARFEFKLEDFWVGVFWKWTPFRGGFGERGEWLDVWICFLPCVPLHLVLRV